MTIKNENLSIAIDYRYKKIQWFIVGGILLLLYGNIFLNWGIDLWDDPNYSHGLIIPFVTWYLIRARMHSLAKTQSQPYNLGLLVLLAGLLLFVLGYIGGELFSKRISFIIVLFGIILLLEGKEIAGILFFPVAILLFAVPLPYVLYNALAFPLKLIASKIAAQALNVFGIPVFREGNIIHLTHTTLEVVDACSGIRSLMTLFTLAFFLAYLRHKTLWKRILLLLIATPVAVIANAGRVTFTGIMTRSNPAWGEGFLHDFSGWLVFVISFGLLIAVSFLIKK